MNTKIKAMRYEERIAAQRLNAYYAKKREYYATLPLEEREQPDNFARVWRNFKQHVKQAYTPNT